jgi:hypothetical protein
VHLLEWEIPRADESLASMPKELPKKIKLENPVLMEFLLWYFGSRNGTLILEK